MAPGDAIREVELMVTVMALALIILVTMSVAFFGNNKDDDK